MQIQKKHSVSIIIPVFNEKDAISKLAKSITQALNPSHIDYEVIWVDDGSTDGSRDILKQIRQNFANSKIIFLARNYGQTTALTAGLKASEGEIAVTLDADMQNDPNDIPAMLKIYRQGYDVVSGWRKNRKDTFIRSFCSRIANRIISHITNIPLHDFGCSLKLYNAQKLKKTCLHGELHRFIPALMSRYGVKITEVPVVHHPRLYGKSKYNLTRTFRVMLDLGTVMLHTKFADKPLYFFGYISLLSLALALILAFAAILLAASHHIAAAKLILLFDLESWMIFAMWLGFAFLSEELVMLHLKNSPEPIYYIENNTESEQE